MKTSVLVCDACPQNGQVVLAKDRVRLTGLTDAPLTLDLCEDHLEALRKSIDIELNAVAAPKQTKTVTRTPRDSSFTAMVINVLREAGRPMSASELKAVLPDKGRTFHSTLANLHNRHGCPVVRVSPGVYAYQEAI